MIEWDAIPGKNRSHNKCSFPLRSAQDLRPFQSDPQSERRDAGCAGQDYCSGFGKAHPVLPSYRDGIATGSKWCFHPQYKGRMSRPRRMISSAGNEVGWSSVSASPKRILPMPLAMHRQPPRDAARAACPPAGELQLPVVMECTRITRSGCSPQRDRRPWPSAPSYYGRGRKSDLFSIA